MKALQLQTMTESSAMAGKLAKLTNADADQLKVSLLDIIHSRTKKAVALHSIKEELSAQNDESTGNPYPLHFLRLGIFASVFALMVIVVIGVILLFSVSFLEVFLNLIFWILIIISIPIGFLIKQYTFKYWLGVDTITIKSGMITTQKTNLEYEKIQDFIVSNNIYTRMLGLADVRFETGSKVVMYGNNKDQHPNYSVGPLWIDDAQKIVPFIMGKMGIHYTPNQKPLVSYAPLSPKKPVKKTASVAFWMMVFAVMLIIGTLLLQPALTEIGEGMRQADPTLGSYLSPTNVLYAFDLAIFGFMAVILLITFIYEYFYYKSYYYDCSQDTLTIRKGVFGKSEIYLPFKMIQNVFMDQDLFDRMFGIYDVHVSTVGAASYSLCHIDGLDKENADRIVEILMKQIKVNIKK
jgi:membrane protein YdbS with pleckstrin-like domain